MDVPVVLQFNQGGKWLLTIWRSVTTTCVLVACLFSSASLSCELLELSVTGADEYSLRIADVLNAPVDAVYKVITDYKHAYRIDPSIIGVKILPSGHEGVVRVRNLSEQCVGPFCFEITWTGDIVKTGKGDLEVKTIPQLSDFVSGSASWHMRPQGGRTLVLYKSRLKPAFFVPPVIGDYIMKKHIKDETLATFNRIECNAQIMSAMNVEKDPEHLKLLLKEKENCIRP